MVLPSRSFCQVANRVTDLLSATCPPTLVAILRFSYYADLAFHPVCPSPKSDFIIKKNPFTPMREKKGFGSSTFGWWA
jgi:hypothetical protein